MGIILARTATEGTRSQLHARGRRQEEECKESVLQQRGMMVDKGIEIAVDTRAVGE